MATRIASARCAGHSSDTARHPVVEVVGAGWRCNPHRAGTALTEDLEEAIAPPLAGFVVVEGDNETAIECVQPLAELRDDGARPGRVRDRGAEQSNTAEAGGSSGQRVEDSFGHDDARSLCLDWLVRRNTRVRTEFG